MIQAHTYKSSSLSSFGQLFMCSYFFHSLFHLKIGSIFFVLIITICGGIWPLVQKARQHTSLASTNQFPSAESFACGIFLGAGLLHMLPTASDEFATKGFHYPFAHFIAALGFLVLLFLEHATVSLKRNSNTSKISLALLTALMLSVHSLLEGAAIGIAQNFLASFIILIAVMAHKGAVSFALSTRLSQSLLSLKSCITSFSLFAIMTPIGIFLGAFVSQPLFQPDLGLSIVNSLAAGTFIYIGTLHGLERASMIKLCCNLKEFFIMSFGFALMAVVAIWT